MQNGYNRWRWDVHACAIGGARAWNHNQEPETNGEILTKLIHDQGRDRAERTVRVFAWLQYLSSSIWHVLEAVATRWRSIQLAKSVSSSRFINHRLSIVEVHQDLTRRGACPKSDGGSRASRCHQWRWQFVWGRSTAARDRGELPASSPWAARQHVRRRLPRNIDTQ